MWPSPVSPVHLCALTSFGLGPGSPRLDARLGVSCSIFVAEEPTFPRGIVAVACGTERDLWVSAPLGPLDQWVTGAWAAWSWTQVRPGWPRSRLLGPPQPQSGLQLWAFEPMLQEVCQCPCFPGPSSSCIRAPTSLSPVVCGLQPAPLGPLCSTLAIPMSLSSACGTGTVQGTDARRKGRCPWHFPAIEGCLGGHC